MYCHLNVKTGTRADGKSAVAKYEYISRIGKYSFGFHDDVVHVESGNMPAFAASEPRLYWAAADEYERSNGRLFRSLTGALPNALDFTARLALARSFAAEVTAGELPYTLALHAGDVNRGGVPDNPHFHLVFSERVNDGVLRAAEAWFRRAAAKGKDPALGGARKSARTKPREWLVATRHGWAAKLNQALERAGIADRVTAESHETLLARAAVAGDVMEMERLVLNPPAPHIGPSAKHRWEDRDLVEHADRYAQHEQAVERAWSIWWTHTKQIAEAEVGWAQVESLDVRIAELEAEQRVEEAATAEREERERQEAARRAAEERRRADVEEREGAVDAVSQGCVWRTEEQREVLAGAERPLTLDERDGIVERVERRIGEDLDLREGEVGATVIGAELLEDMSGAGAVGEALRGLAARERIVEKVEQRVDKDLRDREEELRSIAPGEQYLAEAKHAVLGVTERPPTFAERESMVTTAGQRLAKDLDEREVRFLANGGSQQLLASAIREVCAYEPSGDGPSLSERSRLIALAEQWHAEALAADAEWSTRLDSVEEMLRATSIGAGHLSAAQQEVENAGRDPSSLETRETVVTMARRCVERELDGRETAVSWRRCAGGSADEVDGAGLYTGKLAELEAGAAAEGGSLHPAHREQALVWAERQMDRLDVLSAAEALDPFFGKLAELGSSRSLKAVERSLDHAENQRRRAAARRQARIDALSEDERHLFNKHLDVLEPSWRETKTARSANIDSALDYAAATQLADLDRSIERRRLDIHETPGDGYARLLRAGFERESRQGKVRALTAVETYLGKHFDQQEEKIRTDEEGEAFLRRGRVEVLETDRVPETLAERGRVLEMAEALRQAAMAERRRRAAAQRHDRLKRLFAVPGGDLVFFAVLDACKPRWREQGTVPADIDVALDRAERRVDRRQPVSAEHAVIVGAEQTFPDASSEDFRQAGVGFPQGSHHAHISQRLSDRRRASALAAERAEPPATPARVQRIITWLRTQVDRLLEWLGVVKPVTRQPAPEPAQPVSAAPTGHRTDEEAREKSVSDREGEQLDRLEKEHVGRAGHEDLLVEAAGALGEDGRTLSLGERWEVYERAQSRFEEEQRKLDREEAAVRKDPAGEEFLRNARHEVIGIADREVTLAERARIVKAAATLQQQAEQEREWEELERLKRTEKYEAQVRHAAAVALENLPLATSHLVDDDVGLFVAGQMFGRLKERARDEYVRDTISEVEREQCSKDANHPVGADVAANARDAAVQDHLMKIAEDSHRILIAEHEKASRGWFGRRPGAKLEIPTLDVLMQKETERHESQLLKIFEAACDQVRPLQQHGRPVSEVPPPEVRGPELPQQQGEDATVAAARAEERLKKGYDRLKNRLDISFEDFKKIRDAPLSENTGGAGTDRPAPQTGEPAQAPADRSRNR